MSRDRYRTGCVVFVGNLPGDITEEQLEDVLDKFGRIRRIELKTPPRPPAFAFVEFDDPKSAEDAVRKGDVEYRGSSLRIELARGGGPPPIPSLSRRSGRNVRSPYRVLVKGLPMSASWQDVKDHFRRVVDPTFAKVYNDRDRLYGIVEFETYSDLKYAIRKLDDTEFRNRFERAYIRVVNDSERSPSTSSRSRSRSRSKSHGRGKRRRSYSRSQSGSRSRTRSRSRSRSKSKYRSRSRSSSRVGSSPRSASRSVSPSDEERRRSSEERQVANKGGKEKKRSYSQSPRDDGKRDSHEMSQSPPKEDAKKMSGVEHDHSSGDDRSVSKERSHTPDHRQSDAS